MPKILPLIAINPLSDRDQPKSESKIKSKARDQVTYCSRAAQVREDIFIKGSRSRLNLIAINPTQIHRQPQICMLIAITKNMIAINIAENPENPDLKTRKQL